MLSPFIFFFFNDTATTEIYTLSLHDALPISALPQGPVDPDHGELDEVGGGTLQRRVGGRALPEGADVEVLVLELRNVAPAAEQRLDKALVAGLGHRAVEPRAHSLEPLEVLHDELGRLLLGDAELARQRERTLAVDGGEVDGLGPRPHVGRHLVLGDAEDDRGRLTVDVPSLRERVQE